MVVRGCDQDLGLCEAQRLSLALGEVLRDLPDMAVGIGERGGAHPPLPVDRAVEQLDAAVRQLRDDGVRVLDKDRELDARARVGAADAPGSISSCAAGVASRLTIVFSNLNAAEFSSSKSTGTSKTFS